MTLQRFEQMRFFLYFLRQMLFLMLRILRTRFLFIIRQESKMRSSNQKNRTIKQQEPLSENRMMKTATQTRNQNLAKTNYNPTGSKKKVGSQMKEPVVKKQFNIEENMTVSRINEAQLGLQLLKKKMVARGMSRDKPRIKDNELDMGKIASKPIKDKQDIENINVNGVKNYPPLGRTKQPSELEKTITEKPRQKQPNITKQATKFQNKNTVNINSSLEAPIKPKKDFNALLEEELRKQGLPINKSEPKFIQDVSSIPNQYNVDDEELIKCHQGCGRMFNPKVLAKHENICQKVFQSKRKAFDSAAHRAPEVEGFVKPTEVPSKKQKTGKKILEGAAKQNQIPKWKAQSLAFRAGLKQGKGQELTKEEKVAINSGPENQFVQCKFCGRKFNQTAATRHIPFCESKSKQLPRKKR